MQKPTFAHYRLKCPVQAQQSDSHCGPAVVQALLNFYGIKVTQEAVVATARAKSTIIRHGMRPDQLAKALAKLAPKHQFWFKQYANSTDLDRLIHEYQLPVAINWQGLFWDTLNEEKLHNPNGEHGHYSLVIDINANKDQIVIADPFYEYNDAPRIFSYTWFKTRWWDVDHLVNKSTHRKYSISTKRLIFIVVPKTATFPQDLHFQLPDQLAEALTKK
jgi:ABC-type bacteriocin/lantibiotic exporter with double-glycine peptidase domain